MTTDFVRVIRIKAANGGEKMLEIPAKLDLERPKRPRTVFSEEQLEKLENAFTDSGYLCGQRRINLAKTLGLSDNQVKVWFQNRRTKQKRMESTKETDGKQQNLAGNTVKIAEIYANYTNFNFWQGMDNVHKQT